MDEAWANALQSLERACSFQVNADYHAYSHAIDELRRYRDPLLLRRMLMCLRDVEGGESQYELLEACEAYPPSDYVAAVLDVGEKLSQMSPQWFELLLCSTLNAPAYWRLMHRMLNQVAPKTRAFFRTYITSLSQRHSRYQQHAAELDAAVS